MAKIDIIVGSMLGGTEYVAEACEETLQALGHTTSLHLQPNFEEISKESDIWLICTSTHGAGDYPDNFISFATDLKNDDQDLSTLKSLIIGVGDSSYDTFCCAAKNINNLLNTKGCNNIKAPLYIDMQQDIDPEDHAQEWISDLNDHL